MDTCSNSFGHCMINDSKYNAYLFHGITLHNTISNMILKRVNIITIITIIFINFQYIYNYEVYAIDPPVNNLKCSKPYYGQPMQAFKISFNFIVNHFSCYLQNNVYFSGYTISIELKQPPVIRSHYQCRGCGLLRYN